MSNSRPTSMLHRPIVFWGFPLAGMLKWLEAPFLKHAHISFRMTPLERLYKSLGFLSRICTCLYFLRICIFYQTLPTCRMRPIGHWTDQYILRCSRSPLGWMVSFSTGFSDHLKNGPRAGNFPRTQWVPAHLAHDWAPSHLQRVCQKWSMPETCHFLPTKIGIPSRLSFF